MNWSCYTAVFIRKIWRTFHKGIEPTIGIRSHYYVWTNFNLENMDTVTVTMVTTWYNFPSICLQYVGKCGRSGRSFIVFTVYRPTVINTVHFSDLTPDELGGGMFRENITFLGCTEKKTTLTSVKKHTNGKYSK